LVHFLINRNIFFCVPQLYILISWCTWRLSWCLASLLEKTSNVFFWDMKYFNFPKVLISNSLVKYLRNSCCSASSSHVTIMSSTYTNNIVTPPGTECLTNKVWSSWLCFKLKPIITLMNLPNHTRGDSFSPYKVYFN